MLVKKYSDCGEALSENESKEFLKGIRDLNDLQNEYKLLNATSKEDNKEKIEELEIKIQNVKKELIDLESSLQSVYQHTADAKAERDTLIWYTINLSKIIDENNKPKNYFLGLDYEERLEDFYNKFESDNNL